MNNFNTRQFRDALGRYPTGVAVITARNENDAPVGMTVNSFASVSLDPPLILWSIDNDSAFYDVFVNARHFAVHLLRSDQQQLSHDFSSEDPQHFAKKQYDTGIDNLPLLETYSALFQCAMVNRHTEGDHEVLIGRVLELDNRNAEPLVFFSGHYHSLAD